MKKYAFGVDVGGTTCKIGFFETDGKLIDKWEIKTNKENGGASILSDVAQAIEGKLTEKGISRNDVQGIGVGVPGPVLGCCKCRKRTGRSDRTEGEGRK